MQTTKELQTAVKEFKEGRQESFNQIYEMSYQYLHTCVIHVVKNEDAAMDMLQETYLEISKNISQLGNEEKFLGWAAVIANRKCFAYLKKTKDVLVTANEEEEETTFFDNIADDEAFIPEELLQDQEKQRLIREIIDNLNDMQRMCIIGFYYNEQKQEEIAEELGIPVNTVKSHLNRAKSKIKEAVVELDEKKGTRLYSMAPFMAMFFGMEADACAVAPMNFTLATEAAVEAGAEAVAETAGTKGAVAIATNDKLKVAGMALKTKVIIGTIAVAAIATIGTITAVQMNKEQPVIEEEVVTENLEESTQSDDQTVNEEHNFSESL